LSLRGQYVVLKAIAKGALKKQTASLQAVTQARNIVIVLPEDLYKSLCYMEVVNAFTYLFRKRPIDLVCDASVAPYLSTVSGVREILPIAFTENDGIFDKSFTMFGKKLAKRSYDTCFLLDDKPSISRLALCAATRATHRVSLGTACTFPFSNVHFVPDQNRHHLSTQMLSIVEMIGLKKTPRIKWATPKESVGEIKHLLNEQKISPKEKPIGVDGELLICMFGHEWVDMMVKRIGDEVRRPVYIYIMHQPDTSMIQWLKKTEKPVLFDLSPSRLSALVQQSLVVITGKGVFSELAYLFMTKQIGIYREQDLQQNCRQSERGNAVTYAEKPDDTTVLRVVDTLRKVVGE